MLFPLRIDFIDDETAHRLFDSFPPDDMPYLEGWSRKRAGASQVMLLRVPFEDDLADFIAVCRRHAAVTNVVRITEDEFWAAPSNSS